MYFRAKYAYNIFVMREILPDYTYHIKNFSKENEMTHTSLIEKKSQAGFTLVELAIVMIIIGLLIGGVLKGQELIGNAEVAATASQVEAFDAATTTFNDIYDGLPGDLAQAQVRIPNCGTCANGDGNGILGGGNPGTASSGERDAYWNHMHFADLIGGVQAVAGGTPGFVESEIEGEYTVGSFAGGTLGANASAFRGLYATISRAGGAAAGNDTLTASQAARLDRKLDDGQSNSGSVFANDTGCDSGTAGEYDEADPSAVCDMHFRIQ